MMTAKDKVLEAFRLEETTKVFEVGLFKVTFKVYGDNEITGDMLYRAKQIIGSMSGAPIASIKRKVHSETNLRVNITLNRFVLDI